MRRSTFALLLLAGAALALDARADVKNTVHNLSAAGPGDIRADVETRICIFCHAPHHASQTQGLLWNRTDSTATYIPYESATLRASVGQPTGASKLCLSCHDGTVALGQLHSEPSEVGFVGGVRFLPAGRTLIGTDLGDDHPISFVYDSGLAGQDPGLLDPSTLTGPVHLDPFGQLQCTACHDPHDEGFGKFLVAEPRGSALCLACHAPIGWPSSSHATSLSTWDGSGPDPWPRSEFENVADNACKSCHRSHGAGSQEWILSEAAEEDNCLGCHGGSVASTDILSQITEPFRHGVELSAGVHTPNEDPTLPMTSHVECTDCHSPHASADITAQAPLASGALRGVSGVSQTGAALETVSNEYEVCFKCHGPFSMTQPVVNRQVPQNDKVLQFDLSSPSYHPVEGLGRSLDVPSLFPPMNSTTIIYCSDCHANQNGPGAGGTGASGPHGSIHSNILERAYNIIDGPPYDTTLYDLCYKCHSEQSILANDSFPTHNKHVLEENAPCSVCHDPHGISSTQGTELNNSHLINFDMTVVSPDPDSGLLQFEDLGDFRGRCFLQCHGEKHSPEEY